MLAGFVREFNRRRMFFRIAAGIAWLAWAPYMIYQFADEFHVHLAELEPWIHPSAYAGIAALAALLAVSLFVARCPSCHRYIGSLDGGTRCDRERAAGRALDLPRGNLFWLD